MQTIDWIVLILYFTAMTAIGIVCMWKIRHQEDYFLGGRSFGRVMQAFAAFGAGTGANDPVVLGRTVYTSGMSGIWSVLLWLFVTPFYWIFGVWYRRMRHITLGDWFVERYQSSGLGSAYAVFGFFFYMMYLSVAFSAVTQVCQPLIEADTARLPFFGEVELQYALVPAIASVVIIYGVLGGLRAAYWTDLIQGVFILLLSILLIPFGLWALVKKFGDPETMGVTDGFEIMHQQVSPEYFDFTGTGEFTLPFIAGITLINLVGIVVQPHFIATGGGSAKNENSARVGLVAGNFMKRLCTVGWALTALIVFALLAGDVEMASDPDRVWGIASKRILGPLGLGLVGLMLACLLAALMSSADCYMLVSSALLVRNIAAPVARAFDIELKEKHYVLLGRILGFGMIAGAAWVSLTFMDVFGQLKFVWEMTIIFAAVFWIGMFWRGATRTAAWVTVVTTAAVFFLIPILLPAVWPKLREDQRFVATNDIKTIHTERVAAPADVAKRQAEIESWEKKRAEILASEEGSAAREAALAELGPRPEVWTLGHRIEEKKTTGGKSIYWWDRVVPTGEKRLVEVSRVPVGSDKIVVTERWAEDCELRGVGFYFNASFLLYDALGVPLESYSNDILNSLRYPPRIVLPFVLMVILSFFTRKGDKRALDRFYVKMKTPTDPDRVEDRRQLELSYAVPDRFDGKKLFPGTSLEFQKPTLTDILGFVIAFAGTFAIIGLAWWVVNIGS